jgi:ABC-type multidrug transport system fused ATPase/permease subunit
MTVRSSRKNNGSSVLRALLLFKMFELLVVVMVLSVLYYTVIDRVMQYRAQYESAEVSWTIAAINTAKKTSIATETIYRALGKQDLLRQRPRSGNPIDFLAVPPRNYLGEMCDPDPRTVVRGGWYFDKCNQWLVYVFNSEKFFAQEYPKMLRFNVESLHLLTDPA